MFLDYRSQSLVFAALTMFGAAAARADVFNMPSGFTSLQFVSVNNPGNAADTAVMTLDGTTGYGSVSYSYDIGKFDVTAAQYCAFLNAVAATDTYGLYSTSMDATVNAAGCNIVRSGASGSYTYAVAGASANRPVNFVSWGDAARFCNWLQNDQPTGGETAATTEDGAYLLNGANTNAALLAVTRKTGAQYFLPTENEWYKAAYYDAGKPGGAGYWTYATKSNTAPSNTFSATGTNNANYNYPSGGSASDVGAFAGSPGPCGTFDQNGDVNQWLETTIAGTGRTLRGGAYNNAAAVLASTYRNYAVPLGESATIGFRVAGNLQSQVFSWQGGSGDTMTAWGVATNWTPIAEVPDGPGVNVLFGSQPAACSIVDMISVGRTVANIVFVATTSTLIQSTYGYSLTLDNHGNLSTLDVSGTHYISAPVILKNNCLVTDTGTLTLWGGISGSHTLTVAGHLKATSIQVDTLAIGSGSGSAGQSVPEPGAFALVVACGLCFAAFGRRRLNRREFRRFLVF